MATNTVIGSLRINLGMSSAELSDDVKTAKKLLGRFQRQVAGVAKVAAAAFAGLAGAASAEFVSVSQHADKMAKSAQKIGIPVEELSTLAHAAELSGVSFANLETGIGRFSSNITDALNGLSTEGARALSSLDVSLKKTDGTTKSTSEILGDIAERFQAMPDGAQKTAIAMRVFGKSGRDLIPMLNAGRDGIKEMTDEAKRFGLQITGSTGKAAEQFNDNITRVQQSIKGVAIQVVSRVLPAMRALSDRFVAAMAEGGAFEGIVDVLTGAFNGMIRVVLLVADNLGTLYNIFKIFVAAKIVSAIVSMSGAFLVLARSVRATGLIMGVFTLVQRAGLKSIIYIAGAVALATGNFEKMSDALGGLWDRLNGLLPEGFGENVVAMFDKIDISTSSAAESFKTYLSVSDAARNSFTPLAEAAGKVSGALGKIGSKSTDAWKGLRKVSDAAKQSLTPIASAFQNTFGSAIDSAIEGTFNLREAISGLAKQIAKMALNKLFMSFIGGGFGGGTVDPWSGLRGFADGGSFNVGGSGGIDSQIVAFRASPSENVSITKPGQSSGSGGSLVIHNDFRGAEAGAVQGLSQKIDAMEQGLLRDLPRIIDQQAPKSVLASMGNDPTLWRGRR